MYYMRSVRNFQQVFSEAGGFAPSGAGDPPGAPFLCGQKWGKEPPGGCGPLDPRSFQACADAQKDSTPSAKIRAGTYVAPRCAAVGARPVSIARRVFAYFRRVAKVGRARRRESLPRGGINHHPLTRSPLSKEVFSRCAFGVACFARAFPGRHKGPGGVNDPFSALQLQAQAGFRSARLHPHLALVLG